MMKFCIISDTRGKHKVLSPPPADVIIHCGDFTSVGKEHEICKFMEWFSGLEQYKHKIIIAGNHDMMFEYNGLLARSFVPNNVHYLQDSGVEIDGVKFYGSPVQIHFYNWVFNRSEEQMERHWKAIPVDTDVLITHSPPLSVMDSVEGRYEPLGSPSLYNEVIHRVKPKIHCFGNIHSGHGIRIIGDTTFINASILDEEYMPVYEPTIIEI